MFATSPSFTLCNILAQCSTKKLYNIYAFVQCSPDSIYTHMHSIQHKNFCQDGSRKKKFPVYRTGGIFGHNISGISLYAYE